VILVACNNGRPGCPRSRKEPFPLLSRQKFVEYAKHNKLAGTGCEKRQFLVNGQGASHE
jgi:hypothetical protein